jgi:hypothetical protein
MACLKAAVLLRMTDTIYDATHMGQRASTDNWLAQFDGAV